jgi:hypothetical protein
MDNVPFDRRAVLYNGSADFEAILQEEMSGKYIERVQNKKPGDILIISKISDPVPPLTC